jgi:AGZA family xanthine/uracil permease-like MFS transporter
MLCFAENSSQWFVRAVQGSLWRRDGHAVFVDENEHAGEGNRSFVGSDKELVEVHVASRPQPASDSTQTHQE